LVRRAGLTRTYSGEVDSDTARRLASAARVGHLATVAADGTPHLVPVCFALVGDVAFSCVDHKPKSSRMLRRIANVQATGQACLLVDEYDEDWSRLWWVRLDGRGRIVEDSRERATALEALAAKYAQYRDQPPEGSVLAIDVSRFSGWAAEPA
jgi:PPOX class probable F420-dependent enzyme